MSKQKNQSRSSQTCINIHIITNYSVQTSEIYEMPK